MVDRLSGWKDIAKFFGKSERTVRRWNKEWPMPVRKIKGSVVSDEKAVRKWERQRGLK